MHCPKAKSVFGLCLGKKSLVLTGAKRALRVAHSLGVSKSYKCNGSEVTASFGSFFV